MIADKFICEVCGKEFSRKDYNSERFCSKKCRYASHSIKMKQLHESGTYIGTSYLTTYNQDRKYKFKTGAVARSDYKRALATNCKYSISNRYFYIYTYGTYFKIGVLLMPEDTYWVHFRDRYGKQPEYMWSGEKDFVCLLEYYYKINKHFNTYNYRMLHPEFEGDELCHWTECFDISILDKLIKFNDRIKKLTRII